MKIYCAWCKEFVGEAPDCDIRGDSRGGICAKWMLEEAKNRPVLDMGRYKMGRRKEKHKCQMEHI